MQLNMPVAHGQPCRQAVASTHTNCLDGWDRPKCVWHVGCPMDLDLVPTSHRFSPLDNEQSLSQPATDVGFCSCNMDPEDLPIIKVGRNRPWRRKRKKKQVYMEPEKTPVSTNQASPHDCDTWRPYSTCYFLPGNVHGLPVLFLIEAGCKTNLLGKHMYDWLPQAPWYHGRWNYTGTVRSYKVAM